MRVDARVLPFGEEALLVELGHAIDDVTSGYVRRLDAALDAERATTPGLGRPVPGYATVLLPFDAAKIAADAVEAMIRSLLRDLETDERPAADADLDAQPPIEVPVRYGGSGGPDLAEVAERTGLSPDEVVRLHSGTTYRVHMLGFAPGFAYLGVLPEPLRLPRRSEPRTRVPGGSVAIAGAQTAVYPFSTPGGWHLIGRTELAMWRSDAEPPARLPPGARVRFVVSGMAGEATATPGTR